MWKLENFCHGSEYILLCKQDPWQRSSFISNVNFSKQMSNIYQSKLFSSQGIFASREFKNSPWILNASALCREQINLVSCHTTTVPRNSRLCRYWGCPFLQMHSHGFENSLSTCIICLSRTTKRCRNGRENAHLPQRHCVCKACQCRQLLQPAKGSKVKFAIIWALLLQRMHKSCIYVIQEEGTPVFDSIDISQSVPWS